MTAALDHSLLRQLRTRGHRPAAERPILAFTRLGEHGALWLALAAAGAVLDSDRRGLFTRAGATIAGAYVSNQAIKLVVRRRRPTLNGLPPLVPTHSQISYPSAHASTSFAGARALGRLWPATPLYVAAAAMALSRLYAGVHYPTDVVAGAVLGSAVAELTA